MSACVLACVCVCVRECAAIPVFGHTKILHTLIGMGSATLAGAVPYPSNVTRNFCKEQ